MGVEFCHMFFLYLSRQSYDFSSLLMWWITLNSEHWKNSVFLVWSNCVIFLHIAGLGLLIFCLKILCLYSWRKLFISRMACSILFLFYCSWFYFQGNADLTALGSVTSHFLGDIIYWMIFYHLFPRMYLVEFTDEIIWGFFFRWFLIIRSISLLDILLLQIPISSCIRSGNL